MSATQESLYEGLEYDPGLSWSERDLPQRLRTKHVHSLHPYLGKYIPQLVEELFRRHVSPGGRVLDPFAGSGTTLVQALESGLDSVGVDIAAFNCLLMRVKTQYYNLFVLERELRDVVSRLDDATTGVKPSRYLREWFAPQAARELLAFRERSSRDALLRERGARVELEPHLVRRLAGLGEHAQSLVESHGIALGGIELPAAVPRRQQIHEP